MADRHPLGQGCPCVKVHAPKAYVPTHHHVLPQSWGGPTTDENMVWICPNTHTATHRLLDEYVRANGDPGWAVRRQFLPYVRTLAQRAWDQRPDDPNITSLPHA